jgi:hypothetical protein
MAYQSMRAGPWSARLEGSDLADLRLGALRVISRLGVRVRDTAWGTVGGELAEADVERHGDGFALRLESRHTAGGMDVLWRGEIAGTRDGGLEFEMDLKALADTEYNRIGLVVLHAAPATAGRPYRARGPDGDRRGRLPRLVGPQPMNGETVLPLFPAFTELELELGDGLDLRFEFEGDVFEMEDQRNWSDGSFKTYSTPVSHPVPYRLRAGEHLRQRVRLRAAGEVRRPATRAGTDQVEVVLDDALGTALPPIGLGVDHDGHQPSAAELDRLRALAPAHLRLDLGPRQAAEHLGPAAAVAAALGAELELAVTVDDEDGAAELEGLAAALREPLVPVARIIVTRRDARVTDPADVARLRQALGDGLALVGGTDRYFAEINRDRPAMDALDGLAYPLTPQVHDTDDASLVESLAASADTVATARDFSGGAPVHVTPVTLKPRWNPFAGEPERTPPGELPSAVDPRQPTSFAAAWTVGSVRRLAEAGAASMTYFELTGWRGVTEREAGSPLPERFHSRPGEPFPVLWVLAEATRGRGAQLLRVELEDPLAVEALALLTSDGPVVLVANLRPEPTRVRLRGGVVQEVARLTAAGFSPDGAGPLDLEPWSVVRVRLKG